MNPTEPMDRGERPRDAVPPPASTRTKRLLIAGIVIAALVVVAWVVSAKRGEKEPAAGGMAGMEGMAGMQGMAGMNMSADGSVVLTSDQIRTFGITFANADMRTLESEVRTAGTVVLDETKVAQVAPKIGGFIERLYVDFTGQQVRRGQPLMEIYSPELLAAQQELLLAARLEESMGQSPVPGVPANTTDLVAAAKRRFALWDVSEAQVNEILRTGRTRRTLTVYAPVSGVVTEKKVVRGQSVMPGEHLYTIADLSRVWVEAELRAADVPSVRIGSVADIEIVGLEGRALKGRVEYIQPMVEGETRTVRARVAVPNTTGILKPGMYATVRLSTSSRTALTVPSSAVLRTGERAIVFVDMGGGQLMPHDVELGRVAGDFTEVLTGLEPGQRVVTSAQFLLDSESNLGEVMKSMLGQGGAAGMGDMKGMDMGDRTRGVRIPAQDSAKTSEMNDKGADMKGMKMPPSAAPPRPR
ncbi:MAG: efflux RND transporter periplasmic adaptor subunit [Gemmatimonadota bacterium]|nr:efflux RND transporter periplasmic adaptor subunit [Gemmatimonadota bacterium]